MKYFTWIEGEERVVELTEGGVRSDDGERVAELATSPAGDVRHLRLADRGLRFTARRIDDGWEIRVDGRSVRVRVENERTRRIRELAGEKPGAAAGVTEVRAPMPGLVVRVLVEEGQSVEPGTGLLIMEAMKMQNELRAEDAGIVAAVAVEDGSTVNHGDLLVRLEAETS